MLELAFVLLLLYFSSLIPFAELEPMDLVAVGALKVVNSVYSLRPRLDWLAYEQELHLVHHPERVCLRFHL